MSDYATPRRDHGHVLRKQAWFREPAEDGRPAGAGARTIPGFRSAPRVHLVYYRHILLGTMLLPEYFSDVTGFQWDDGNSDKNWNRHRVRGQAEAEQVFLNRPLVVSDDHRHSIAEPRHFALGRTAAGRELMISFTVRGSLLRIISARPMSRREREIHGQAQGS